MICRLYIALYKYDSIQLFLVRLPTESLAKKSYFAKMS